jgi:transposase-like protein
MINRCAAQTISTPSGTWPETVSAFFQDMRARGFGDPLLVASDGASGIIKAIETCFLRSARQRLIS